MEPLNGALDENMTVEVAEIWWRPCAEWPKGMLLVISGDMPLAFPVCEYVPGPGELDAPSQIPCLPHDLFPWDLNIGSNFIPFSIFADGAVERLIGPQKSLNHGYSRMRQALNWASMPAMLVPNQSGIKQKAFSDIGGDVVRFNAPYKPEILKGDGVNAGHLSYVDNVRATMNDISGYTDEARGLVNSANATAARIRTTDALNERLHGSTLALKGFFLANVTKKIMTLIANCYDESRLLYAMGKNNQARVLAFYQGMVNPDGMFTYDPSTMTPKDQAAEREEARRDFEVGIYDDTPAAARYRRANHIAQEADGKIDPDAADWRNARERAVMFMISAANGAPPEDPGSLLARTADNNDIHLDVYRLVMLEPAFAALDPMLQDWFQEMIVIPHQEARDAKLAQQLGEEQAINGGGKGAPPPGKSGVAAPGEGAAPGRPASPDDGQEPPPAPS
jgi:hypothetical protein